ncbi:NAD(P)H-dependent oxidoreductase [Methylobacillus arboreus]|uniref:NAD(P)H-dependent oxidoreductase n=1 Tax=Methylobacillus arboreus TaxID=755170 RepID=UPI001E565E42|nr:NAD(P)H-dependent oxidoreductase [Methylobacillus arboreus]MCB5189734.1 NAD(P)H-dependent oxidoreductase [Methylobacillus arboreus]
MAKIVGISGSLTQPSRTKVLVEEIVASASKKLHAPAEIIDIAQIAEVLGSTISYSNFPAELSEAYAKLQAADLLIIASPVYKASYAGLLKHFFDLLDPKALVGKVAILAATGGSDQHALVVDYQLRTLASFFSIYTTPTAIYAKDTEFTDYQLTSDAIHKRVEIAVEQAVFLLKQEEPQTLVA